jgi:hypothetical protein
MFGRSRIALGRIDNIIAAVSREAHAVQREPAMPKRRKYEDDDELISVRDFEAMLADHANAICFRCKVPLKDHTGADHLFFEEPDEAPDEESN